MTGAYDYFQKESTQIGRIAKSLPEQVAETLLRAIRDGAIEPGERLKEEIYAERFAVSRSTVREAMALLERRGVVERVPRYGVRVVAVDAQEIEEIFQIRAQLLGLAARMVTEQAPEGFSEQFLARAAELRALADSADTTPAKYANLSIETQRMLVSACSGRRLKSIYEGLSDQPLWRYAIREKSISFSTQQRRQESAEDWKRLAEYVAAGDAAAAECAARDLLLASYRSVLTALGSDEKAGAAA